MALSNIGNEPRREITESLLGVIVTFGVLWGDFALANKLIAPDCAVRFIVVAMTMVAIPIGAFAALLIGWGILELTHNIGEGVCALLTELGFDPRPKQRYGRGGRAL